MNYWVKSNTFKNITRGFTLIEVLISSFILFLVLTSITMVYRGAMLSSSKAERTLYFSSFIEPISERVRIQLQAEPNIEKQGQGSMGEVTYNWHAIQTFQGQAPASIDGESGLTIQNNKVFRLWDVKLKLKLKNATREYSFSKVTW